MKISCLLALGLLAPLVYAEESPLACATEPDGATRLACYDRWAAAQRAMGAQSAVWPVHAADGVAAPLPDLAAGERPQAEPLITSAAGTTLGRQWDLDQDSKLGTFVLRAHQPTYILPVWYQFRPNDTPGSPTQQTTDLFGQSLSHVEVKYQISFKSKLMQNVLGTPADLWFGYTQQSHWQMYNKKQSSPFRDTDYEPELLLTTPLPASWHWGDWRMRMAGVGLVHQSNGQPDPLSRSWNRVVALAGVENGNLSLLGRWWYRLPESASDDDNPDISRYMGHADVQAVYRWGQQTLGGKLRFHPGSGRGAAQLDWTFPVAGRLRGYVQGFSGYGENLLDYNHYSRGFGFGLMMTDWLAN